MAEKGEKEPFEITPQEADKLTTALRDEGFRKLLMEYAQEMSDPANKKRYEDELIQLEKQRGVDMKFLKPKPGFVLRSYILPEGTKKMFMNICQSDTVEPAKSEPVKDSNGRTGEKWNIPYSLTTPREDLDKAKSKCSVIDAVFHPDTYERGQKKPRFLQLLIDTTVEGIEENMRIKLDMKRLTQLKKMSYKGSTSSSVIRSAKDKDAACRQNVDLGDLPLEVPYPPLKQSTSEGGSTPNGQTPKQPPEPQHTIVYSGEFSMQDFTNERNSSCVKRPRNLIVTINLPGVKSASCVDLDIYEKRLTLECADPLYKLDLALSYPVDDEKGKAKFDKAKKTLTVTLPVLPPVDQPDLVDVPVRPLVSEIPLESENETVIEDEGVTHNGNSDLSLKEDDFIGEPTNQDAVGKSCDNRSSSHVTEEWTSVGDWSCPPFSYRQDESSVTFVLYTPCVKEQSLVSNFDQSYVQLMYKTAANRNYSFYVSFSDGCDIESDDCVLDVSDENVVILLTKETKGIWEKFSVGLNTSQTTDKLFLTESNVQSALEQIEHLPDPWVQSNGLSDSAQVKVVSTSETHLDVSIVDQSQIETEDDISSDVSRVPVFSSDTSSEKTVKHNQSEPVDQTSPKPVKQDPIELVEQDQPKPVKQDQPKPVKQDQPKPVKQDQPEPNKQDPPKPGEQDQASVVIQGCDQGASSAAVPNSSSGPELSDCKPPDKDIHTQSFHEPTELVSSHSKVRDETEIDSSSTSEEGNSAPSPTVKGGSFVQVEKDGSMFVRADTDYLQSRAEGKMVLQGRQGHSDGGVQFSNKLIYSLD